MIPGILIYKLLSIRLFMSQKLYVYFIDHFYAGVRILKIYNWFVVFSMFLKDV